MKTIFTGSFMHQYLSTDVRMNGAGNGNLSAGGGSKCVGITDGIVFSFFSYQFLV